LKRIAVFAALAAPVMALPAGSATASTDCPNGQQTQVTAGPPVVVCVDLGGAGDGSTADAIGFYGGKVEVDPNCLHAIVDGDDDNTFISSNTGGYVGLSNCETGTRDPDCDGIDEGWGSNSGGCLTIRNVASLPVPLLVCGNTTGKSWDSSPRDGCTDVVEIGPW
jgi:hypothetical protein